MYTNLRIEDGQIKAKLYDFIEDYRLESEVVLDPNLFEEIGSKTTLLKKGDSWETFVNSWYIYDGMPIRCTERERLVVSAFLLEGRNVELK